MTLKVKPAADIVGDFLRQGDGDLIKTITQDRQATAEVLCALLEEMKSREPHSTIEKAQDIIRVTLSNKDV